MRDVLITRTLDTEGKELLDGTSKGLLQGRLDDNQALKMHEAMTKVLGKVVLYKTPRASLLCLFFVYLIICFYPARFPPFQTLHFMFSLVCSLTCVSHYTFQTQILDDICYSAQRQGRFSFYLTSTGMQVQHLTTI
jgi:hypothetical protein